MSKPESPCVDRPTGPAGWRRHFSGWQAGGIIVLSALATAALVTPLAVPPARLPLPTIDRHAQHRALLEDQKLARLALAGLPPSVDKVAIAVRRLGRADAADSQTLVVRQQLWRLVRAAQKVEGNEALLALRARQGQQFVAASRAALSPSTTAQAQEDLQALGGQLYRDGRKRGWFSELGFAGDERTLAVLFKIHWNRATGLETTHPYSPSLTDWKIYYRFLLDSPVPDGADPVRDAQRKLVLIQELIQHDDQYPALLAQGIVLRRANKPRRALGVLTAYQKRQAQGRWSIWARNHIAGCLTPTRSSL